jgi:hypothetical protein
LIKSPLTWGIIALREIEVLLMVTEWEKEELGRLTHQKIKTLSQQQQDKEEAAGIKPGRMTLQNLQCMKTVQTQSDTKEARFKLIFERLKMAIATALAGLFAPSKQRLRADRCKVYGHNLPFGTTWQGEFPKCLDCGAKITDPTQLRGAVPKTERDKFKSYGEF